jgi:hypothetical protein
LISGYAEDFVDFEVSSVAADEVAFDVVPLEVLVDFEVSAAAGDEFAPDVVHLAVLLIVGEEVSVPGEMKQKEGRSGLGRRRWRNVDGRL